jgi:hypothetical protein
MATLDARSYRSTIGTARTVMPNVSFAPSASVPSASALVAKASVAHGPADSYLQLGPQGQIIWVADPGSATPFASMREAARAALRLPARDRAYGLPRDVELGVREEISIH